MLFNLEKKLKKIFPLGFMNIYKDESGIIE